MDIFSLFRSSRVFNYRDARKARIQIGTQQGPILRMIGAVPETRMRRWTYRNTVQILDAQERTTEL